MITIWPCDRIRSKNLSLSFLNFLPEFKIKIFWHYITLSTPTTIITVPKLHHKSCSLGSETNSIQRFHTKSTKDISTCDCLPQQPYKLQLDRPQTTSISNNTESNSNNNAVAGL